MKKVVICGTGQLEILELLADINNNKDVENKYELLGFLDDNNKNFKRDLKGYKILGGFDWISKFKNEVYVINSIARNTKIRKLSNKKLEILGAKFINLIHPSVKLEHCKSIGKGNIIFENSSLKINSEIGNHNMILSRLILGHDSVMGSYCFAGHNSICQGGVKIEDQVFLGSGCNISNSININKGAVIAIGAILLRDAKSNYTYIGNPAKGYLLNSQN